MKWKKILVAGIGTGVGKTIVSAVLTEALEADYWKPVQTGQEHDSETVRMLISNTRSKIHSVKFSFVAPISPWRSGMMENKYISKKNFEIPICNNHLIIETAGGLYTPLSDHLFNLDLPELWHTETVLVCRPYVGYINHTLLSLSALKSKNIQVLGRIICGEYDEETENLISRISEIPILGSIREENRINKMFIKQSAKILSEKLQMLVSTT